MIWFREDEVKALVQDAYLKGYNDNKLHQEMVDESYKRGRADGWYLGNQNRITLDMERQKLESVMVERKEFVGDCIFPDGGLNNVL